ncbi:TldD/PmbA family protein [Candidatus Chlorohelix sp.]|uniref:TldD/PmbA family protein n=1 Tax=Candidatus Chlorohelix sp. TaxID=3139201 RepID=UPI0030304094
MPKKLRVTKYDDTVEVLLRRALELDVYAIGRIMDTQGRSMTINNGRLEGISTGSGMGVGVSVFTREGYTGFASSDRVTPESAHKIVETAAKLAFSSRGFGAEPNRAVFEIASNGIQTVATDYKTLTETSYEEQVQRLKECNEQIREYGTNLAVRSSHWVNDTHWRIVRSDGTDISFDLPHAAVGANITLTGASGTAVSTYAAVSGPDVSVLLDNAYSEKLDLRARKMADLAQKLVDAPRVRGGNYKLVIDYALAKGLAHEAFGHASETDGMETSILGKDGKMRLGEQLAATGVTITDGSELGDYAYQPISANGMPRQTVEILKDGVLRAGLADLFSAAKAGVPITGAERIESYRNLPIPRMSNIRISVANPIPLATRFELVTPLELREALLSNGLMQADEQVLYLSGYKGGQVNPKDGDFVFNCASIYALHELENGNPKLYQPAIFSGKVLSALHSILAGIGPVLLDAQGHCGKAGQSVPSSGGANSFIVIDRNENVTIGGD